MKLRALVAASWVVATLSGCAKEEPAAPPPVSTDHGDGDGDGDSDGRGDGDGKRDASAGGAGGRQAPDAARDASTGGDPSRDASDEPDRPTPPTDYGVHVSIGGEPYETASEIYYFEAARPNIQAELRTARVRFELRAQLGAITCAEGASVDYEVGDGHLSATRELGACTVDIEAFGDAPGDAITATVHAMLERASGEIADALELDARIQVTHP